MDLIGFNEILILMIIVVFIILPVTVAYRMGKQKGRLMEMERQKKNESGSIK